MLTKPAIALLAMLAATAALAQEKKTEVVAFVSNPEVLWSSSTGQRVSGAYGIGIRYHFRPQFSLELSAASELHHAYRYANFSPIPQRFGFRSYPINLDAAYHFTTSSAWQPYVGAGLRYVDSPSEYPVFGENRSIFPEVVGGVVWQFHPSLGLRFDAKKRIGDHARQDEDFKGAVGLQWRW